MSNDQSSKASAISRLLEWSPVFAILALLVLPAVYYVSMMSRQASQFVARNSEVEPLMDAVYLYYFGKGKWPDTIEEIGHTEIKHVPTDWQYMRISEDVTEPPLLVIRGPLHMRMEYAFRKDGNLTSPGGWSVTSEGTPWPAKFTERIPQRPGQKGPFQN